MKDKKLGKVFTIGNAFVVLGLFISFLLVSIYTSRVNYDKQVIQGHKSYTDQIAWSVAYFFLERNNELASIATTVSERGHSDPSAPAQEIKTLLSSTVKNYTWGPDKVYDRLIFVDKLGNIVADTNPLSDKKNNLSYRQFQLLDKELYATSIKSKNGTDIVVAAQIKLHNKNLGHIIGFLNKDVLKQKITISTDPVIYTLAIADQQKSILLKDKLHTDKNISYSLNIASMRANDITTFKSTSNDEDSSMVAFLVPIKNTSLHLFNVASTGKLTTGPKPWHILTALGALSIIVLGGGYQIFKSDLSNRVLNAQLDEEAKQGQKLKTKNIQLANEISQRVQSQQQLAIEKDRTDKLNVQLTETLEREKQLTKKAQAANIAKSEFLANMSHELQTPLQGVLGFSEIGLQNYETIAPSTLQTYFKTIYDSGKKLHKLIVQLIDLARLESNRMEFNFQPINITTLIAAVMDEFYPKAHEKNIVMKFNKPDQSTNITIDPERIQQVIRHILSNAIGFSPENLNVEIDLEYKNKNALVTVRDYGPGIPVDEIETIFDKFHQSKRTKTKAGGKGLGLALSKKIIENHHGKIWAQNAPDKGTVISFELPCEDISVKQNNNAKNVNIGIA